LFAINSGGASTSGQADIQLVSGVTIGSGGVIVSGTGSNVFIGNFTTNGNIKISGTAVAQVSSATDVPYYYQLIFDDIILIDGIIFTDINLL
jgi:hypothetical protein